MTENQLTSEQSMFFFPFKLLYPLKKKYSEENRKKLLMQR